MDRDSKLSTLRAAAFAPEPESIGSQRMGRFHLSAAASLENAVVYRRAFTAAGARVGEAAHVLNAGGLRFPSESLLLARALASYRRLACSPLPLTPGPVSRVCIRHASKGTPAGRRRMVAAARCPATPLPRSPSDPKPSCRPLHSNCCFLHVVCHCTAIRPTLGYTLRCCHGPPQCRRRRAAFSPRRKRGREV